MDNAELIEPLARALHEQWRADMQDLLHYPAEILTEHGSLSKDRADGALAVTRLMTAYAESLDIFCHAKQHICNEFRRRAYKVIRALADQQEREALAEAISPKLIDDIEDIKRRVTALEDKG